MIYCFGNPNIRFSHQKVSQFSIHHRRQVFPYNLLISNRIISK